jgi:hypothetical protein
MFKKINRNLHARDVPQGLTAQRVECYGETIRHGVVGSGCNQERLSYLTVMLNVTVAAEGFVFIQTVQL